MSKGNAGYRLGLFVRRLRAWDSSLVQKAQQRGIPGWVAKIPALLVLVAIVGLLLAGAVFIALFITLLVFIALFMAGASKGKSEYLEGYHSSGPEGPGTYVAGKKVSDDDEDYYS